MRRRCPAPLTVLAAALAFGLGSRPLVAQADAISADIPTVTANYTLTSPSGLPAPGADITGPQVQAVVLPPGGVVPPTGPDGTQGSPLTILPGSHGFDASQLVVALKDTTNPSGEPEQMFGLVFFGEGLAAGGVLHFSLNVDEALANSPPKLESQTAGITITSDSSPPETPPVSGGTPPISQIPEPVSLVLWSAMAGVGLWRARGHRRAVVGRS